MEPKHPEIHVKIVDADGNAFAVLAAVNGALKSAGIKSEERMQFAHEATCGDYVNMLQVCRDWVTVE